MKACISRYDNGTYTRIQFLRAVGHCVGSLALCPEDGSAESDVDDDDNQEEEVSVDSGDDQSSADVGSQDLCEVCLHDGTARHTTSACALRTPALLWFLYHKDLGRRPRLPDVPRANHHDSAPVLVFHS